MRLRISKLHIRDINRLNWDVDAKMSSSTIRSSYDHLKRVSRKHIFSNKFKIYGIYSEKGNRVGHYALLYSNGTRQFYDGIRLLNDDPALWSAAMRAALEHCGPGVYSYGWAWSTEPSRVGELTALAGVSILENEEILVHGVDFAEWPNWETYKRAISENCRRNANKAARQYADIRVIVDKNLAALRRIPTLIRFRYDMYRRKELGFRPLSAARSYIGDLLLSPAEFVVVSVIAGRKVRSVLHLERFGNLTYYFDGASSSDAGGTSWFLMLEILKSTYEESPTGKFLMGYSHKATLGQPIGIGLERSRAALRVRNWSTSVITFRSELRRDDSDQSTLMCNLWFRRNFWN